ncbi:MAG: histidine phosphatase family protein [Planctomycetales bacterium]
MILYCVRHGESAFNAEGRIQGQMDAPLSELGRRQGEAVGKAMASIHLDAVYSSPLSRAHDTAIQVAEPHGLEIQLDDRLKEINAGVFQGKLWPEIEAEFPNEARAWKAQEPGFRIPEGESRRELMDRGAAALRDFSRGKHEAIAVVAHGGMLTAALKTLLEIPPRLNPFQLFNCSISQLVWNGQFQLLTLNERDHLRAVNDGQPVKTGDL